MLARFAFLAGVLTVLSANARLAAQTPHALPKPPDKAILDRLNLRQEWAIHLPLQGTRDAVTLIQSLDDQLFIQTRTGMLFALDAASGRLQWSVSLGDGRFSTTYPVAVNSRFVYAVHVTRLYAFFRYSGLVEFQMDLDTMPLAGLTADENRLYLVLAHRPGFGGVARLEVYDLPKPIVMVEKITEKEVIRGEAPPNPVDELLRRYPSGSVPRTQFDDTETTPRPGMRTAPSGGYTASMTPSLAVVPSVNPPYYLESGTRTPEVLAVPSLRQPYRLQSNEGERIQKTASVTVIPPSVAAALALSDLKPKGLQPKRVLDLALDVRILYPLLLTPLRAWVATDAGELIAASTKDRAREVYFRTSDRVSAPPVQAGEVGYFPLADGNLLAIDLAGGNLSGGAAIHWRATVGGLMNHPLLLTQDAVYASGEHSGVARVDRNTGEVLWKTDNSADVLLAANPDFAYIRDHQGRLLIYDARQRVNPAHARIKPLTGVSLPGFDVNFTNTMTDRLYLAASNGLLVCLRDASAKYSRPMRMAPEPPPPPKKKEPGAEIPAGP